MSAQLLHFRNFCENLRSLSKLEVGYDNNGGVPLRRKALQTALEIFGVRPDLTLGSFAGIHGRGDLKVDLFRGGRDLMIWVFATGSVKVHSLLPGGVTDIEHSEKAPSDAIFEALQQISPFKATSVPLLDKIRDGDCAISGSPEGVEVVRIVDKSGNRSLLCGRRSLVAGAYAFQPLQDLPEDLLSGKRVADGRMIHDLLAEGRLEAA